MAGDDVLVSRETPVPVGLGAAWLVFVLALGSGAVVFVAGGLLCWALALPVSVAMVAAAVAVLSVWLLWMSRIRGLLMARETVRSAGAPACPPRPAVQVEIVEPERGRVSFLDVPCDVVHLAELGRGLLGGRPFSESEWSGSGRPFSRAEFRSLRSALLERGFVAWRDAGSPSQGVELTASGMALCRHLAGVARAPARVSDAGRRALSEPAE